MKKILLFFVLFFLVLSRFFLLKQVPVSMARDELVYSSTAKFIAKTGKNLTGSWKPFSLKPVDSMFAELPATLMIPAAKLFNNSFISARFTHALLGLLFPFVFAFFITGLFKNKKLFTIGLIIASFNPWLWQFSRMNFDPFLALFFLILASGVYLNNKGYQKLLSIPIFFLSFFMYQGIKITFLPWIFILTIFTIWQNYLKFKIKKNKIFNFIKTKNFIIPIVVLFFAISLVFSYYKIALPKQEASSRLSSIVFLDKSLQNKEVNQQRRTTIDNPLIKLMSNKLTFLSKHILIQYGKSFNPTLFFINSERNVNQFAVSNHGVFYLIDLIFLLFGIFYLIRNVGKEKFLILGLLIISPITSLVSGNGYSGTFRNSPLFILLLSLISFGIYQILSIAKSKTRIVLIVLYLLSTFNFAYQYFFTYPIRSADHLFYEQRVLAEYLNRLPKTKTVSVHVENYEYYFKAFLYFNNLIEKNVEKNVVFNHNSIQYKNINFTNQCIPNDFVQEENKIIVWEFGTMSQCKEISSSGLELLNQKSLESMRHLSIVRVSDSGGILGIINDQLCSIFTLKQYVDPKKLSDFDLKKLSQQEFCQKWLTTIYK